MLKDFASQFIEGKKTKTKTKPKSKNNNQRAGLEQPSLGWAQQS